MTTLNKALASLALSAALSAGLLALTSSPASARVVCNGAGDCWHTDHRYHYAPELQVQIHPDDWYFHRDWAHDTNHHWRDYHEGRGYYRNGAWIVF